METESQCVGLRWAAACFKTTQGAVSGSLRDDGCVNRWYLSAVSSGLSELSQPRRGAGCFNCCLSRVGAAGICTYRHKV